MVSLKEFQLQLECAEDSEDKLNETTTKEKTWEFPCHKLSYVSVLNV
jgi:hypothetical protein